MAALLFLGTEARTGAGELLHGGLLQWREVGSLPGEQKFRLHVFARDGVDGMDGNSHFILAADGAFSDSYWTLLLPLVGVMILTTAFIRFATLRRLRRKLMAIRQQQLLDQERVRIAQDLHDDLGARVTKISLLAELAHREQGSQAQEHISRISATSKEVAQALDEIVWAVDPKHDTLDGFSSYLCSVVEELFRDTPVRCRLNVPALLPVVRLPSGLRHNLLLAVTEALNNLLKHAKATEALVSLSMQGQRLTLAIEDNGCGFDPAKVATGNGLTNLRRRMDKIGGHCAFERLPAGGTRVVFIANLADFAPSQPQG